MVPDTFIPAPRRIGGERIRRGLIAEGTAVGAEGIVDAVRLEGASGSEGIRRGIRIKRIRAQLAEIFRPGRNSEEKHQNQNPPHEPLRSALTSASTFQDGEPPTSGTTSGLSLLPTWRSAQGCLALPERENVPVFRLQVMCGSIYGF